jgi:hypothetical protein
MAVDRSAAACGITIKLPACKPTAAVVPIDPSFVITASAAEELTESDVATTDGQPLPFDVVPINEAWARVVVSAPAGTEFLVRRDGRCTHTSVWTASTAWSRQGSAPVIDGDSLDYYDGAIALRFDTDAEALRLDWAFRRADVGTGRQGTMIDGAARFDLEAGSDRATVFVRATPLLLDGSEGTPWDGWIHRDRETNALRFGTGAEPEPAVEHSFDQRTPWVVGEAPVLTFELDRESTFLATSFDGAVLPTMTFECDGGVCVAITADIGTELLVEELPRGRKAPWTFHVVDGPALPRFVVTAVESSASGIRFHVTGPTALHDGAARITWADAAVDVVVSSGAIELATDLEWGTQALRFELVPLNGELLGEACEGWVHRDPATGALALQEGPPSERSIDLDSCLIASAQPVFVGARARASRAVRFAPNRQPAVASIAAPATSSFWLLGGFGIAGLLLWRVRRVAKKPGDAVGT